MNPIWIVPLILLPFVVAALMAYSANPMRRVLCLWLHWQRDRYPDGHVVCRRCHLTWP